MVNLSKREQAGNQSNHSEEPVLAAGSGTMRTYFTGLHTVHITSNFLVGKLQTNQTMNHFQRITNHFGM